MLLACCLLRASTCMLQAACFVLRAWCQCFALRSLLLGHVSFVLSSALLHLAFLALLVSRGSLSLTHKQYGAHRNFTHFWSDKHLFWFSLIVLWCRLSLLSALSRYIGTELFPFQVFASDKPLALSSHTRFFSSPTNSCLFCMSGFCPCPPFFPSFSFCFGFLGEVLVAGFLQVSA